MKIHADAARENADSQPAADKVVQGCAVTAPLQCADNRSTSAAQRKLQQMASIGPQAGEARRVQLMADDAPGRAGPVIQDKENHTGLPDALKSGIETLSGYSMDGVKVHYNSNKPHQLQAHAYAQGTDIHLATGQERHLPHEAWHVVQQSMGRVKPTMSAGGVHINDDPSLEREADAMGERALQYKKESDGSRTSRGVGARQHIAQKRIVQRYLKVGVEDHTYDVRHVGADLDARTQRVKDDMEDAVRPALFPVGSLENNAYQLIQADANGLVTRQVKKWIEDNQGAGPPDSQNAQFGRKQQARVYANYHDLAMAIYGWVSSKEGRRQEKRLAHQVYASPIVEDHIDSVLTKIHAWIGGLGAGANIAAELSAVTQPGAHWADYAKWFNHTRAADGRPVPPSYYPVLQNPGNYSMRDKIATLHDVMRYFMGGTGTSGAGQLNEGAGGGRTAFNAFQGTTLAGRAAYVRPQSTVIPRNPLARELIPNLGGAQIRASDEETHPSYIYARTHQIPMWARHSYTAARMMRLAEQANATQDEITAVAHSIMAFWRKDYDHRSLPYHTLHEIMDFREHFGVNLGGAAFAYNPLTRYDDMHTAIDSLPALMARLTVVANSANWNGRARLTRGNQAPTSIVAIRAELGTAHADGDKLLAIKNEIRDKTGISLLRTGKAQDFYTILEKIPDNVNLYQQAGTAAATKSQIAVRLSAILRELRAFTP
ncbi:DUF4157 domain-containing protein [Dyella silvae]|uniref:eCIS core domain-containing protein n=1 Tax=Dyella silvae TaxID=2994424 RepID=UPI002263C4B1|nr:DUF4157 domain-containing protein [Dyella silvae]